MLLQLLEPNRKFCDALFSHAPDPRDPLSPFSEQTRPIRERAIEQLRIAVEGGDGKVPSDLKARLPYLLWLYPKGAILFLLFELSPPPQHTRQLREKCLGLIISLPLLSPVPLVRPL